MYIRKNKLKEKIKKGEIALGMEFWLRDPRVIELAGQAGFDIAHVEYEHVGRDWQEVENMIRTGELYGMTTLFRCEQIISGQPPVNQIIKALKCGAQIIMVPHVETADEAKKIVDAVKFAPMGHRGLATCDRSGTAMFPNDQTPLDVMAYAREANAESMIWCIIETPKAVENIDAILAVDGIDVVGFGHQDYALAAGYSADDDQRIVDAREKVRAAVKRAGKLMWWNTLDPESIAEQHPRGIQIFLMGVDTIYLDREFRRLARDARAGA
ncbi:MAG: aldolase/citrate lyase family protein [Devosia sp.]